jgi:hypothetical protein
MSKLAKNKYNLVIDPEKGLFRWKVDADKGIVKIIKIATAKK